DFLVAVEVGELALVPHLDRTPVTRTVLADAYAFRVEAVGAERRRAGGADPLAAAFVAFALLFEALLQRFHELVPTAHGLDLGLLFLGQFELVHALKPVGRNVGLQVLADRLDALEVMGEDLVEAVEFALVLDQAGT